MDAYKAEMVKRVGPGGFKCPCCNDSRHKKGSVKECKDRSLNKLARKKLKEQDRLQAIADEGTEDEA